jgi:hypothetical protein
LIAPKIFGEMKKLWSISLCSFLQPPATSSLLCPKHTLQHPVLRHLYLCSSHSKPFDPCVTFHNKLDFCSEVLLAPLPTPNFWRTTPYRLSATASVNNLCLSLFPCYFVISVDISNKIWKFARWKTWSTLLSRICVCGFFSCSFWHPLNKNKIGSTSSVGGQKVLQATWRQELADMKETKKHVSLVSIPRHCFNPSVPHPHLYFGVVTFYLLLPAFSEDT